MMESLPKYIDPMTQLAHEMNIKIPTSSQTTKVREIAQELINKLVEEKLGWKDKKIGLIVNTHQSIFDLNAIATPQNVYLPPLYFISKDEVLYFLATGKSPDSQEHEIYVPLTGPDDPRLSDNKRLQDFADHLSKKLGIPQKKVTWEDQMHMRMYVTTIHNQDNNKINDTISFIIMHELGHIKEDHKDRKINYRTRLKTEKEYLIVNYLTLGVFEKIALDVQSRKHEKEADRFGYTGEYAKPAGGVHLFKTVTEFEPQGCKEVMAYALFCFSTLGSHGTYEARMKKIEKYLNKNATPLT